MRLRNGCPCSDDFPSLAAPVARSTDLIQSAKRGRQLVGLGKRALAGGFTCAVNVKDGPGVSRSIYQSSRVLIVRKWTSEQIIEKEHAQRFDGFLSQRG